MSEHTMISACACMPPREQDMEDASVPGHPFVHTECSRCEGPLKCLMPDCMIATGLVLLHIS